jgi:hypothetical protein
MKQLSLLFFIIVITGCSVASDRKEKQIISLEKDTIPMSLNTLENDTGKKEEIVLS